METEKNSKRFELRFISDISLTDTETNALLLIGLDTPEFQEFLTNNREIFGGKEIFDGFYYYSMVTFIEDGYNFTMLNPYQVSFGKYPKRNFAFGAYSEKQNSLRWFFDGKPTTNDRKTAMLVHNSLARYCEVEYPDYIPFAIKL